MIIVNENGDKRVNSNNIEFIEDNGLNIIAHLISGATVTLCTIQNDEKREKAIVALDEAIINIESYKHIKNTLERDKDIEPYKEIYIFYMSDFCD